MDQAKRSLFVSLFECFLGYHFPETNMASRRLTRAVSRKSRGRFGPGTCFVLAIFAFTIKFSMILKIIK